MNLVLRQSAGKAGIVCFLMCLGTLTSLHGQQEDSLYFSQPVMPVLYSPWAVTPFERQPHESYFSMDSVSSLRGVLKVRFESADKWTGFSSDGQTIFLYEAVYDRYFRLPFQAPLEWYVNEQLQRRRVKNFATVKKPGQEAGPTRVGEGVELVAVETSLGRATLTVNGNVNLTGKIVFQDQVRFSPIARAQLRILNDPPHQWRRGTGHNGPGGVPASNYRHPAEGIVCKANIQVPGQVMPATTLEIMVEVVIVWSPAGQLVKSA